MPEDTKLKPTEPKNPKPEETTTPKLSPQELSQTLVAGYTVQRAHPSDPTKLLSWLGSQPDDTISQVLDFTLPPQWALASTPLVDSLSPDQKRGVLALLIVMYYVGRANTQSQ